MIGVITHIWSKMYNKIIYFYNHYLFKLQINCILTMASNLEGEQGKRFWKQQWKTEISEHIIL